MRWFHRRIQRTWLAACVVASWVAVGHAQTLDIDDLVARFESSVNALGSVELKQTLTMSDGTVNEVRHFLTDGGVRRLSRVVPDAPKDRHRHFEIRVEGDTTRRVDNFDFGQGNKVILSDDPSQAFGAKVTARIAHGKPDPGVMLVEWHLLRRFRLSATGMEQSLRELVASAPRQVVLTTEQEGGHLIYRLAVPHPGDLSPTGERLWPDSIISVDLDPDLNYLARRVQHKWIDGERNFDVIFEAKDYSVPVEGAAIPQTVEVSSVQEGKQTPNMMIKTELISVNEPIEESKLALNFPGYCTVLEDATATSPERIHFIGADGEIAETFEDDESFHAYMEKTGLASLSAKKKSDTGLLGLNRFRLAIIAGNVVLVALLVAIVIYFRRRHKVQTR